MDLRQHVLDYELFVTRRWRLHPIGAFLELESLVDQQSHIATVIYHQLRSFSVGSCLTWRRQMNKVDVGNGKLLADCGAMITDRLETHFQRVRWRGEFQLRQFFGSALFIVTYDIFEPWRLQRPAGDFEEAKAPLDLFLPVPAGKALRFWVAMAGRAAEIMDLFRHVGGSRWPRRGGRWPVAAARAEIAAAVGSGRQQSN